MSSLYVLLGVLIFASFIGQLSAWDFHYRKNQEAAKAAQSKAVPEEEQPV